MQSRCAPYLRAEQPLFASMMTLSIMGDINGAYEGKRASWAQGRGACPHINSCTALSHLKEENLITGTCEREYWNLIVQIRQSAPLFVWYNVQPVMHHKTTLRHTHPTQLVFLQIYVALRQWYMHIICLEAKSWRFIETDWMINAIFTSILSGGLVMNSERQLDNHDISWLHYTHQWSTIWGKRDITMTMYRYLYPHLHTETEGL